jgi:hypothetical protein
MLEATPPPTRYFIVKTPVGAKPYSLVVTTVALLNVLVGSYTLASIPILRLFGLGNIEESEEELIPAPNCNSKSPFSLNLVTNLLGDSI